jgi:hypothetical protein
LRIDAAATIIGEALFGSHRRKSAASSAGSGFSSPAAQQLCLRVFLTCVVAAQVAPAAPAAPSVSATF